MDRNGPSDGAGRRCREPLAVWTKSALRGIGDTRGIRDYDLLLQPTAEDCVLRLERAFRISSVQNAQHLVVPGHKSEGDEKEIGGIGRSEHGVLRAKLDTIIRQAVPNMLNVCVQAHEVPVLPVYLKFLHVVHHVAGRQRQSLQLK